MQVVGEAPLATVHAFSIPEAFSQVSWVVNLIFSHTKSTQVLSELFKKHDLPEFVF